MKALIPLRLAHPVGPTASRTRARVTVDVVTINLLPIRPPRPPVFNGPSLPQSCCCTLFATARRGGKWLTSRRGRFGAGAAVDWSDLAAPLHGQTIDRPLGADLQEVPE